MLKNWAVVPTCLHAHGSNHPDREVIDVSIRLAARIPVRPVRSIAEGCRLSRSEAERPSGDFTFTLRRSVLVRDDRPVPRSPFHRVAARRRPHRRLSPAAASAKAKAANAKNRLPRRHRPHP